MRCTEIYADKAYIDEIGRQMLEQKQQVKVNTPVKKEKGQEKLELFDHLLSTSVSKIRQPIESYLIGFKKRQKSKSLPKCDLIKD